MNADERLRIATSDEPQTWDTALPNVSPADPGDENTPCRSCGDTGMQNDVEPCQECQQETWEWRRAERERLAATPTRCDWCTGPLPSEAYKFCSELCAFASRADSNDDRPIPS